jgi:uncharacterized membrane protein
MLEALVALLLLSVPITIAIVILVKLGTLTKKMKTVEGEIKELRGIVGGRAGEASAPQTAQAAKSVPEERTDPPEAKRADTGARPYDKVEDAPPPIPAAKAAPAPKPKAMPKIPVAPKPGRTNEEWESLIGGKWLNRIGAFALIIAMGFFLKYAFDNNWITETMRVVIGAGFGVALIGGGWWFDRKELRIFSQGLTGAGIATLYISVYASFNFYQLVPQIPAFALMSLVTAFTLFQAFKYDSIAVAILGWAGGFLTPIMLSTGDVNTVGLFTYIALLDVGLLAIIIWKDRWVVLEPLTLAGTYIMFTMWFEEFYAVPEAGIALIFLTVFWLLFFIPELMRTYKGIETFNALRQIVSALNALLFFSFVLGIMEGDFEKYTALAAAGLALVYIGASGLAYMRSMGAKIPMVRSVITAAILMGIAVLVEFEDFSIVSMIAVEGAVLVFAGYKLRLAHIRYTGLSVLLIAFFAAFSVDGAMGEGYYELSDFLINLRTLSYMSVAAMILFALWLEQTLNELDASLIHVMHIAWTLCILAFITVETSDAFLRLMEGATLLDKSGYIFQQFFSIGLIWMLYSILLTWIGSARTIVSVRVMGTAILFVGLLIVAFRGLVFTPVERFTLLLNIRAAGFALAFIMILVHHYIIRTQVQAKPWRASLLSALNISASLLIAFFLTGEAVDFFGQQIRELRASWMEDIKDDLNHLKNMQQLAISLVWLAYSIGLMVYGFLKKQRIQRIIAFVVFGIAILKIFIYDLSYMDTLYRIFSFIGLGIILLIVSYIYTRYKDLIFGTEEKEELSETE